MDYARPLNASGTNPKVHVALVLLPASGDTLTTTTTAPGKTKQPLLLNPGGPGGSGVYFALHQGKAIQSILGDDQPVMGFDPRGVGYTTPMADCWAPVVDCEGGKEGGGCEDRDKGSMRRREWRALKAAMGGVREGDLEGSLRVVDAAHRGVNALCNARDGQDSILRHAVTENVARDMLAIVDAWDAWTGRGQIGEGGVERGKLVYWGFSSGTELGQTFAVMFPDRVGRMVLDGVADMDTNLSDSWAKSLTDTDKVLDRYLEYCVEAAGECALYRAGDGLEDLKRRYRGILTRLAQQPASFTHPEFLYPVMVRDKEVKRMMFNAFLTPSEWPAVAKSLNAIYEGRYQDLAGQFPDLTAACQPTRGVKRLIPEGEAQKAILCGDRSIKVAFPFPSLLLTLASPLTPLPPSTP